MTCGQIAKMLFHTTERDRERFDFIANIIAHADAEKMRRAARNIFLPN
jgi:hypothetical protein